MRNTSNCRLLEKLRKLAWEFGFVSADKSALMQSNIQGYYCALVIACISCLGHPVNKRL